MKKKLLCILFFISISNYAQTQIGSNIKEELGEEGSSLSLSATGDFVAIGVSKNSENGTHSGRVRVYKKISGAWVQIGKDINGNSEGSRSGYSVSLSADGSIVAIGAPYISGKGNIPNGSGLVKVYQNKSGIWTQIGTDINGESEGDVSGFSVSLSADGNVVAIGAPRIGLVKSGYTRVYKNISGTWTQIGKNINGDTNKGDDNGFSVSLSADGNIVAIGAPQGLDNNQAHTGYVRIYQNISGTWIQIGKDINGKKNYYDCFGSSISLSSDGSIIAIGAPQGIGVNKDGYVRVYKNVSKNWIQIGMDINDGAAGSSSRCQNVSLSSDGNIIAIATPYHFGSFTDSGHIRVYKKKPSEVWEQTVDINKKSKSEVYEMNKVSLSRDGSILAVLKNENTESITYKDNGIKSSRFNYKNRTKEIFYYYITGYVCVYKNVLGILPQ